MREGGREGRRKEGNEGQRVALALGFLSCRPGRRDVFRVRD